MSEVDGATLIARSLKQQGIDHLFGVVGFPVTAIAVAAQKEGVAYLAQRAERLLRGAGLRLSHRPPGACIVVTGPDVVHGLAGLANAQQNCWPMILIGGASETYRGGIPSDQRTNLVLDYPVARMNRLFVGRYSVYVSAIGGKKAASRPYAGPLERSRPTIRRPDRCLRRPQRSPAHRAIHVFLRDRDPGPMSSPIRRAFIAERDRDDGRSQGQLVRFSQPLRRTLFPA
jgi:hypothetical protein